MEALPGDLRRDLPAASGGQEWGPIADELDCLFALPASQSNVAPNAPRVEFHLANVMALTVRMHLAMLRCGFAKYAIF
jgi:hypothetical protein